MTLGTRLFTWIRGEFVGTDGFGNRYYRDKRRRPGMRERRWVLYKGRAEASKVPPEWHGWLHHVMDRPQTGPDARQWPWQKPHRPNPTGTPEAYRPKGHALAGGHRAAARGDYEPWRPA